mmetsp:Transcript_73011/g.143162  ORF Transcript_73011/g.143162 Transcript_73011/m.143162 type:complete len:111 (+) Transcript_73011:113-445(+)
MLIELDGIRNMTSTGDWGAASAIYFRNAKPHATIIVTQICGNVNNVRAELGGVVGELAGGSVSLGTGIRVGWSSGDIEGGDTGGIFDSQLVASALVQIKSVPAIHALSSG